MLKIPDLYLCLFSKNYSMSKMNIEEYTLDDIEWITEYNHHDTIKMKMIA
jgi:thymidylate synthase